MRINYNVYTLLSIIKICFCISTITTAMSNKIDNTVFIYPGQVHNHFLIHFVYKNKILIVIFFNRH